MLEGAGCGMYPYNFLPKEPLVLGKKLAKRNGEMCWREQDVESVLAVSKEPLFLCKKLVEEKWRDVLERAGYVQASF